MKPNNEFAAPINRASQLRHAARWEIEKLTPRSSPAEIAKVERGLAAIAKHAERHAPEYVDECDDYDAKMAALMRLLGDMSPHWRPQERCWSIVREGIIFLIGVELDRIEVEFAHWGEAQEGDVAGLHCHYWGNSKTAPPSPDFCSTSLRDLATWVRIGVAQTIVLGRAYEGQAKPERRGGAS